MLWGMYICVQVSVHVEVIGSCGGIFSIFFLTYGGRVPHLSPVPLDLTSLADHLFQGSPIAASRVLGSQVDPHLNTLFAQEVGVLLLVGPSLPQHRRSGQSWAKHAQAYVRRTWTEPLASRLYSRS